MYLTKVTVGLRISKEGELEGLDIHEHGGGAYPEVFSGTTFAAAAASSGGGHAPEAVRAPVPA